MSKQAEVGRASVPKLSLDRLYAPEASALLAAKGSSGAGMQAGAPPKVSFAGLPPYDSSAAGLESRAELIPAKQAGGLTARELRASSQQSLKSGSLSAREWKESTDCKPASYDAGPRIFKPHIQNAAKLDSGDVVSFEAEGMQYCIVESQGADLEQKHYEMRLCPESDSSPVAQLEVIRQADWLSFRAAGADSRFLQVRKRGAHRLTFFSQNYGTWEQWELLDEPTSPWQTCSLQLRSRRMPQYILVVEVVRLGTYALEPSSYMTPRSLHLGGSEGTFSENNELNAMSSVLMRQWLQFTEREKLLRAEISAKLQKACEEVVQLRTASAAETKKLEAEILALTRLSKERAAEVTRMAQDFVRQQAAKEQNHLDAIERIQTLHLQHIMENTIELEQKREQEVQALQVTHAQEQEAAAAQYAEHTASLMAAHSAALDQVVAQAQEELALAQQAHEQQQAALAQEAQHRVGDAKLRLQHCVQWGTRVLDRSTGMHACHNAFRWWRQLAQHRAEEAWQEDAVVKAFQRRRVAAALQAWTAEAEHSRLLEQRLQLHARHRGQAALRRGLHAFRQAVGMRAEAEEAAGQMAAARTSAAVQASLDAWQVQMVASQAASQQAARLARKHQAARLARAWGAWKDAAGQQAYRQDLAAAAYHRAQTGRLRLALQAWGRMSQGRKDFRATLQKMGDQAQAERMRGILLAWRGATQDGSCLKAALPGWAHAAAVQRAQRISLEEAVPAEASRKLASKVFASWRAQAQDAAACTAALDLRCSTLLRQRQAATLSRALSSWRAAAVDRRCKEAAADAMHQASVARKILQAWRIAPVMSRAASATADKLFRARQAAKLAAGWQAWKGLSQERACKEAAALAVRDDIIRCKLRAAIDFWSRSAKDRKGLHAELLVMGDRAERRQLQQAFQGWAQAAREQRCEALQASQARGQLLQAAWQGLQAHAASGRARHLAVTSYVERGRMQRLSSCFRMWRQMLEDKAAARHRLEVCMTTKRVMLPLMRESCMAALRAEFEAHARRLLGATAATMQSPAPAMPQQGLRSSILTPADYAALAENDDSSCESITPASTRHRSVTPQSQTETAAPTPVQTPAMPHAATPAAQVQQMIEAFFTPGSMAPTATPGPSLAAFHTPQAELRPFPALSALNAPTPPPSTPTFAATKPAAGPQSPTGSAFSPLGQGLSLSVGGASEARTPVLKGSSSSHSSKAAARAPQLAQAAAPQQVADSPSKLADAAEKGLLKSHSWGVNPTPQNTPMAGVASSQGHGSRLAFNISIADCIPGLQVDLPQASCSTPSGQRSELEFSTMPSEGTPDFPSTANVFADSSAAGASGPQARLALPSQDCNSPVKAWAQAEDNESVESASTIDLDIDSSMGGLDDGLDVNFQSSPEGSECEETTDNPC